jgi:hypothetical protein
MPTTQPGLKDHQNTSGQKLSSLSLSTQTIHADDFLNKGQDVAPPLHVSTTFRYNRDPDSLKPVAEVDVSLSFKSGRNISWST